jgi:hypothetical protein
MPLHGGQHDEASCHANHANDEARSGRTAALTVDVEVVGDGWGERRRTSTERALDVAPARQEP